METKNAAAGDIDTAAASDKENEQKPSPGHLQGNPTTFDGDNDGDNDDGNDDGNAELSIADVLGSTPEATEKALAEAKAQKEKEAKHAQAQRQKQQAAAAAAAAAKKPAPKQAQQPPPAAAPPVPEDDDPDPDYDGTDPADDPDERPSRIASGETRPRALAQINPATGIGFGEGQVIRAQLEAQKLYRVILRDPQGGKAKTHTFMHCGVGWTVNLGRIDLVPRSIVEAAVHAGWCDPPTEWFDQFSNGTPVEHGQSNIPAGGYSATAQGY